MISALIDGTPSAARGFGAATGFATVGGGAAGATAPADEPVVAVLDLSAKGIRDADVEREDGLDAAALEVIKPSLGRAVLATGLPLACTKAFSFEAPTVTPRLADTDLPDMSARHKQK